MSSNKKDKDKEKEKDGDRRSTKDLLKKMQQDSPKTPPPSTSKTEEDQAVKSQIDEQFKGLKTLMFAELRGMKDLLVKELKPDPPSARPPPPPPPVGLRGDVLPPCLVPQIVAPRADDQDIDEAIMEQESDMDEDSDDDHGEFKVGDSYGDRASNTIRSTPEMDLVWSKATKHNPERGLEDWKQITVNQLVKRYTTHPTAAGFAAPQPDAEAPDLVYKDKKDMESKLRLTQNMSGAAGSLLCSALVDTDTAIVDITKTISDLVDPGFEVSREEYAGLVGQIREEVLLPLGKKMAKAVDLMGNQHNHLTLLRRAQFLDKVTQTQNARNICKRLNPSKDLLFGGKLGDVAKHLKDSSQLNPLQTNNKYGGKSKFNKFNKKFSGKNYDGPKKFTFKNRFGKKKKD